MPDDKAEMMTMTPAIATTTTTTTAMPDDHVGVCPPLETRNHGRRWFEVAK
jgi:hypothetical protein